MVRNTSNYTKLVPIYVAATPGATVICLLRKNPDRILYSIQNMDDADFIALGPTNNITAGVYGTTEGQHLVQGQTVSDSVDQGEVWATADDAAGNAIFVNIQEVTEKEPTRPPMAPRGRARGPRMY